MALGKPACSATLLLLKTLKYSIQHWAEGEVYEVLEREWFSSRKLDYQSENLPFWGVSWVAGLRFIPRVLDSLSNRADFRVFKYFTGCGSCHFCLEFWVFRSKFKFFPVSKSYSPWSYL